LMSYGPSYVDLFRRSGDYVDKILRGAKPADLPVEQPTRYELVVNLRAAEEYAIALPRDFVARADRVVK
jgi:putative tryptophan/tyrosine transport system substrate-binding protein